jgi:hypothetical protein
MSTGEAGPARLRPLVHPREYWNVWAKMTPVKQQRTKRSPGSLDQQREDEAVWKCMAPSMPSGPGSEFIHSSVAAVFFL